ncbi:MAG TPA: hypothetical protein VJS66_08265 [Burkholderiales bacterium]|nr:hypothetical protein [Burkholderiales bacterium]
MRDSRHRKTFECLRRALALGAAGAFLSAAPLAHAGGGISYSWIKFPIIEVQTDGTSYTGLTGIGYAWQAEFDADTSVGATIKSWKVWPSVEVAGVGTHSLKQYAASKSYAIGHRPKDVHKTVSELFPDVAIKNFALQVCNHNRTVLKNQGHPDSYVFGQEHKIATTINGGAELDVTVGAVANESFQTMGEIVCKKWQGAVIPHADKFKPKTVMQVTKAKLTISPAYSNLTADCPIVVPLVAEFEATEPGTLEFRFVSAHGQVSQTYSATISGKTGGVYKTQYEKQISVPLPVTPAGNSGGKGGAVNQTAGGGFTVATPPIDPLFPGGQPKSGATKFQNQVPAGNVHSESFRVEVLLPNQGVVSAYHGYHITCRPKQNDAVQLPNATFGAQPNQPTAPIAPKKASPTIETPARRK